MCATCLNLRKLCFWPAKYDSRLKGRPLRGVKPRRERSVTTVVGLTSNIAETCCRGESLNITGKVTVAVSWRICSAAPETSTCVKITCSVVQQLQRVWLWYTHQHTLVSVPNSLTAVPLGTRENILTRNFTNACSRKK